MEAGLAPSVGCAGVVTCMDLRSWPARRRDIVASLLIAYHSSVSHGIALHERQRSSDWRWQRAQNGTIARTIYEHSGNGNADFPPKATKGGPREVQPIQKRVFE
jgi:hypothetical protein